jgi:arginase
VFDLDHAPERISEISSGRLRDPMPEFRIIAVPYELGRLRHGVGRGPDRLLAAGAEEALASAGGAVQTEVVEFEETFERTGYGEVDACFDLIRAVAERVSAAVDSGAFPVLLGGSCFNGVGVVAGLGEPSPGVVYLDAHSDFNSPETSLEGYFDGMPLAVLAGDAWQAMHATVPGARPVPQTAMVLAGARSFDPPEEVRLAACDIAQVSAEQMATPDALLDAVRALVPEPTGIYLHLDLDVLDEAVAPVNVYHAPGGITGEQLADVAEAMCREFPVRAVSLTVYDPDFDPEGKVPPIAMEVLRRVASSAA